MTNVGYEIYAEMKRKIEVGMGGVEYCSLNTEERESVFSYNQ